MAVNIVTHILISSSAGIQEVDYEPHCGRLYYGRLCYCALPHYAKHCPTWGYRAGFSHVGALGTE